MKIRTAVHERTVQTRCELIKNMINDGVVVAALFETGNGVGDTAPVSIEQPAARAQRQTTFDNAEIHRDVARQDN